MAKKSSRILVGLVCTETGTRDYVTSVSKLNPDILKTKTRKYSKILKRHAEYEFTKKLD